MDMECKNAFVIFDISKYKVFAAVKGEFPCVSNHTLKGHKYWYPNNITNEEFQREVQDLMEFYDNVLIVEPIPKHLQIEVLKYGA